MLRLRLARAGCRLQCLANLLELVAQRAAQRDTPRQRRLHRPANAEIRGRAVLDVAGAHELLVLGLGDGGSHQVGQLEVLEEDVQELVARQREDEVVYAFPGAGLAAATAPAATLRSRDLVAAHELLVSGMDRLPVTAHPVAKARFGDVLGWNLDVTALGHVGDGALGDHALDRAPDVLLVAAHEALAVHRALVAAVQAPVNQVVHGGATRWEQSAGYGSRSSQTGPDS